MDLTINNYNKIINTNQEIECRWTKKRSKPKIDPRINEKGISPFDSYLETKDELQKNKKNVKNQKWDKKEDFNPDTEKMLREINGIRNSQRNDIIEKERLDRRLLDNECDDSPNSSISYKTAENNYEDISSDYLDVEITDFNTFSKKKSFLFVEDDDFVFQRNKKTE